MRELCHATLVFGLTVFCFAQSGPTPSWFWMRRNQSPTSN